MSTPALVNSGLRFILLLLLQILIFNQLNWGWGGRDYLFVFVYPLFVAMLPLDMPRPLVILLGFLLGLSVDFFSETLGLHAGALTLAAYCRPFVLHLTEPRDGYSVKANPTRRELGGGWTIAYLTLMLAFHCLGFFSLQAFSPVFVGDILLKSVLTLGASLLVVATLVFIFDPKA